MSRMFDDLRKARQRRRKITKRSKSAEVPNPPASRALAEGISAAVSTAVEEPRVAVGMKGEIAKDFVKELGMLRNSLEPIFEQDECCSLLFTSAANGEGTTTIATNFARFLAMQGMTRVLVVEMNARNPAFASEFSMNGDRGVTDYFTSRTELTSLVQPLEGINLDVLHIGTPEPTTIQVNLSKVFPRFMAEARRHYDTVIIDAPSIINFPETPAMAPHVSGVVLVVHTRKTKREVVQRAMDAIRNFDGRILGVVLNRKRYYIPNFIYKRI
ncbi:MAG: CpsD/CapB family tyrosine-protein kinase [bacterium]|nr:CpsD/CapB family tyrosine-protein kinase [bacterium]